MKSSRFKPLSRPVYRPLPLSDFQYSATVAASAFLTSRGLSARDGSPEFRPRPPRVNVTRGKHGGERLERIYR